MSKYPTSIHTQQNHNNRSSYAAGHCVKQIIQNKEDIADVLDELVPSINSVEITKEKTVAFFAKTDEQNNQQQMPT